LKLTHFFFENVGDPGNLDELYLCPVRDSFEDGEVQRFGRVVEDGLLASQQQHRAATDSTTNDLITPS